MKFIIMDLKTGERIHESLFKDRALKFLIEARKKTNAGLFIVNSNNYIMSKVA